MVDIRKIIKSLSPKQAMLLKIGGPILAAAICVVLVVTLQSTGPQIEAEADPVEEADIVVEEEYAENDIVANAISSGEYSGTVLEETTDAGTAYVKETLFIGDSNTAGMILNSSTTNVSMDNGIGIVSMGVSHVTSLKCVKFRGMEAVTVPDAVKIMQPRRIVITYGTNDYYMSPEKFSEAYKKALDAIKTAYPYSDIIIGSIFPITSNCSYYTVSMPTVEKFNLELVKLARKENVKFLNWSEALKDTASGYCKPEYMAGDGVHLSKKGMEEIFKYFRTHKLDSEDKRPKPLKPVPVREPTPAGLLGSGPRTPVDEPEPAAEEGFATVTFIIGPNGQSVSFGAVPGSTVGPVSPLDEAGYIFKGWSAGSGGSFTVPADGAGKTYVVTAIFEFVGGEPPPTDPPVTPPTTEPPPTEPPPTEPPPTDPPPEGQTGE